MTKKIVICLNSTWNIYNFRLNLIQEIKNRGYNVIIVAPYDKYSDILSLKFEYYNISINNKGTNPKEDLKTLFEFYKLYKKLKPDLVLNFTIKPNIYGNIACNFLNINVINNITGLGTVFIKESYITTIVKFLYKYSLTKSSKVFFQNNDDRKLFLKYKLVCNDKSDLIPGSGIDLSKFVPLPKDRKVDDFSFLLIARMLWDKGIKEYVDAARLLIPKYPNLKIKLLGPLSVANNTAISKEEMLHWENEGIIEYLGETENVQDFIKNVDCIVLPSYREGTPRTLLESASMEKPIVTTNVPGCKDVVDDGFNGFLCESKNAMDLSLKMEKMYLLSEEERILMGKNSRKKMINDFDEKIVINKYISAIEQIVL